MAKNMIAQRRVRVTIPASGVTYIDLALLYSASNHRIMHQNYIFKANFSIDGIAGAGADEAFDITTLPTTWPVVAAYKQAREMYNKALTPEMTTAKKARWHSFRLLMDTAHKTQDGLGTKILPDGCSISFGTQGEYVYSEVHDDAGTNTYTWHMLGVSDMAGVDRSFGVIAEYDAQNDTNTDEPGGNTNYDEILNDVNALNELNIQEDGNLPPYNKDNIQLPTCTEYIHATSSVPNVTDRRSTGVMDVPFGLVKVTNHIAASRVLTITFSSGGVKGIAAEVV